MSRKEKKTQNKTREAGSIAQRNVEGRSSVLDVLISADCSGGSPRNITAHFFHFKP